MPRQGRIYDIFLSSPGDTREERDIVEKVVAELNRDFANGSALVLNLLRWETGSVGGIARDPQEVVDRSISQQYDLYIGLMWTRLGTPTSDGRSGTEVEFDRAVARFDRGDRDIDVVFFFRNDRVDLNAVEPAQLEKLRQFKIKVRNKKILFFEYATVSQFENEVRRHVREYARRQTETYGSDPLLGRDPLGGIVTERIISMLRSIVVTVGQAVHDLVEDMPKLAGASNSASQNVGMLLNNALRRADVSERELHRACAPVGLEIRNVAAEWVLQPAKHDEIEKKVSLVLQEISDARSVLADLLPKRGKLGALTVNLTAAIDRYERLVRLSLDAIGRYEQQLRLIVDHRAPPVR